MADPQNRCETLRRKHSRRKAVVVRDHRQPLRPAVLGVFGLSA
ncbi:MAG: hypothetical protein VB064_01210 [Oscillospiraceae bacterium]|nr:hypothetical protein [Oscillospiraceae bacterium]